MTFTEQHKPLPTILITGGSGFLGQRIVKEFLDISSKVEVANIRIFDIKKYPETSDKRIEFIKGDIRDYEQVKKAVSGVDLVVHSAAIVDWGTISEEELFKVNVTGTENVIRACLETGVNKMIFTSSLDAVYSGKTLINVDESQAYPAKHATSYCRSKHLSEVAVMAANSEKLKTLVLRPSDIYGEADPYHIDSLTNMAKGGFYVRLGDGSTKTQHVYVGNMAYAHVLAAEALFTGKKVDGQIYFITDGPAINFFKFFDQVVIGAGYKIWPKNLWLPRKLAFSIGATSEFIAVLARPIKKYQPKFSRFAVTYTCTTYTFSAEKAKQDLGFIPKYTEEEALQNTINYYKVRKK